MFQRLTPARRRSEGGFTLIELLVVIVILGILAAVVVFAVGGTGDKGKASAIAIDARTIKTAEEAFCAQNGRYGAADELVVGGFLSEAPTYHAVGAQNSGAGTCNGWEYSLLSTDSEGGSQTWAATATAPGAPGNPRELFRLSDGRVLAMSYKLDEPYSVTAAAWSPMTGRWTVMDSEPDPQPVISGHRNTAVLLTDDPETAGNQCGSNCGKVMVRSHWCRDDAEVDAGCQAFRLFDPQAASGSQWQKVAASNTLAAQFTDQLSPLMLLRDDPSTPGSQCAPNCGKVLVTPRTGNPAIYDPSVDPSDPAAFTAFSYPDTNTRRLQTQVRLADGRILMVGVIFGAPTAKLFNPIDLSFSPAGSPTLSYSEKVHFPVLPGSGNEVLFTSTNARGSEIYTPQPGGPGTWRTVATGCPAPGGPSCQIFGSLADGRVLGYGANAGRETLQLHTGKAWIFDPADESWSATTDMLSLNSIEGILLDPAAGPCGSHCNKMLVVGAGVAGATALYTP